MPCGETTATNEDQTTSWYASLRKKNGFHCNTVIRNSIKVLEKNTGMIGSAFPKQHSGS